FDARAPSGLDMPFVAWLAIALWPWLGFSEGIMRASESMPQHAGLISKVPMRRELLAISSATAAFVLQLAGYVVVLVVMALLGIALTPAGFVNGALVLAVMMLLSNALGLFAATLRVFFADIQQLLPTLLMLWFFLTPILYSPEYLPEELQILVFANPLAGLMTDLRAALLEGQALPGVTTLVMLAVSVAAYLLGLAFFRRMAPYFEDFL
ncbi:MAG: ABC transporter permease, partial [Wenzhouxiangellaceae bacterium]|nr:ABC transporter permease [Wenzhouxiangellaceae bacterium]